MEHKMKLFEEPYDLIKNRKKVIEIRCNDEKRKKIKVGDTILFYKTPRNKEFIKVKVLELYVCKTFKELYLKFDFKEFGCEGYTLNRMIDETRKIYSEEKEKEYISLGIRIELL